MTLSQHAKTIIFASLLALSACNTMTGNNNDPLQPPVKVNSKAASYNATLGIGYLKQGNVERAKRKLLTALKQGPNYGPAYSAMGYFLEKTGDPVQAGQYYRKALQLENHSGTSENNYGTYLCRTGHYREAVQHFMAATKDPSYLSPAKSYENAGYCALQIPDKVIAKHFFQRAIQEDPMRALSYLELGKMAYAAENYQEANHFLQNYAKIAAPGPESLWLKIKIERKLGNIDAAYANQLLLKQRFPQSAEVKLMKTSGKE